MGQRLIDPRIYDSFNIFFQADPPRVLSNMTERVSHWQNATSAHPLVPLLGLSLTKPLMLIGIPGILAVQFLLGVAAAGSAALMFLALRGLGLPKAASIVFTAVFLSSATFIHWYAFIETFAFAGLSVVGMFFVAIRVPGRSRLPWIVAAAATMAITITNWSLALMSGFMMLTRKQFATTASASFLLVLLIAIAQRKLVRGAFVFLNPDGLERAGRYTGATMVRIGMEWSPWASLRSAAIGSAVVPPPVVEVSRTDYGPFTLVTNQFVPLAGMTVTGMIAAIAWVLLLGLGLWGAIRSSAHRRIALVIVTFIASQLALHSFYGEITFLYAADFLPAMVLLAGFGWLTPARPVAIGTALIFIVFGGINNGIQFDRAAALAQQIAIDKAQGRALGSF